MFPHCLFQFEPESFVDSLLGIGIGSSKEEGRALASRLTQMRNERNARAKTTTAKAAPKPKLGGTNPAGDLTFNPMGDDDVMENDEGMQLITAGGGGANRGSGSKNKSKKRKKRKNKR